MDNGGPAFPCEVLVDQCGTKSTWEGMTLRDYFAAKAMQGMLATDIDCSPEQVPSIVESAYILADAMLAERNK
jgi:hypothetical protein